MFYDAAGRRWFPLDEQRHDVPFEQISPYFKDAVISVEDHRYYWHFGIDPIGVTRAAYYNLRSREGTQGGSTITQQLARTLYLSNVRTFARKAQEAALAVMLEVFSEQEGDPRALFRPRLSQRRRLRRRNDVGEALWQARPRS
jgi:penicillin-binding protein 1A